MIFVRFKLMDVADWLLGISEKGILSGVKLGQQRVVSVRHWRNEAFSWSLTFDVAQKYHNFATCKS